MVGTRWAGAALLALLVAAPLAAQQASKERIQAAIARGVAYVKANPWLDYSPQGHGIGPAALAGLACLECGVPANDPFIVKTAKDVRDGAFTEVRTYQLALAVMFLDRLGDFNDDPLIQVLALRLMLGQDAGHGGWTYQCTFPVPAAEIQRLKALMPPNARVEDFNLDAEIKHQAALHAAGAAGGRGDQVVGPGDNSNTQFALLALWIAKRHRMPRELVDQKLLLCETRFRRTQLANGTWGYVVQGGGGGGGMGTPAMTCAGLIGLAVGHGVANQRSQLRGTDSAGGSGGAARPAGGKGGTVRAQNNHRTDPQIIRGLQALGGMLNLAINSRSSELTDYYFWYSMERVCVVYDLDQVGGRDWHAVGADIMVANQAADGSWTGSNHARIPTLVDTCFVLLFLKQANIAQDLKSLLRAAPKESVGDPLVVALKQATGAKFDELLAQYADPTTAKGNDYTVALARAIPELAGDGPEKARAALTTRLGHFKATTLSQWLKAREAEYAEVRAAAARAAAAKGDPSLVPSLIDSLADTAPAVRAAAHEALRTLTRQDLGPTADPWKKWWAQQRR